MKNIILTRGFSPVEALLAVTIFALMSTAFIGALVYGREATMLAGKHFQASLLAEEGIEAVRSIRDEDFSLLTDGTYGLDDSGGQWNFNGVSDTTDIYLREITISTVDATTKEIDSVVSWQQNEQRTGEISLNALLTNWMLLDPPTSGNWSNPAQESFLNINGNQNGWAIEVQGNYAYAIRQSGNPDFIIIDISDTDNPILAGSLNLNGNPRGIVISGNTAYVASSQNNQELQVIDISNPNSPSVSTTYNAPGNADGRAVAVDGNTLYLVRSSSNQDEIYSFNIANPFSPVLLDSTNLGSGVNYDIALLGNYAYVASARNNQEIKIINISNPSNLNFSDSYNMANNNNAFSIDAYGNTLLAGRQNGELYVMNLNIPNDPVLESIFDAQNAIRDISIDTNNDLAFLATDENSAEFQVVDISNISLPILEGSFNVSGDINGVFYDSTTDRAFTIGESNAEEFRIFEPN